MAHRALPPLVAPVASLIGRRATAFDSSPVDRLEAVEVQARKYGSIANFLTSELNGLTNGSRS
jgi:hypothetical protein